MKVAVVGTCPSSRMLAATLPDDWQIWVCSPGNDDYPRVDLWFELHGDLDFPSEKGVWRPYINWLNAQSFPLIAQRLDLFPRAKPFPHEALVKEFGEYFFTSQPAWMMAYAIYNKFDEVGLFGLDMSAQSEYEHQKPAMHYLTMVAEARGMRVLVPPESDVLAPPPLYGYSYNTLLGRKLRVRELEVRDRLAEMDLQIKELELKRQHFRGVLDDLSWMQQTWTGGIQSDNVETVQVRSPNENSSKVEN